ncbi:hypothetical protein CASFOL_011613 [Castilleja foliolosa]|uniref:Uncharacterized protein n=1 Tax=Castilleja foliolosa TaxID=1961234 RepID=A0ABD3DVZ1_9LAMI
MGDLYALDFDGVLCDSCGESSLSAVKAAKVRWPNLFNGVDSLLEDWIVDQMHILKPITAPKLRGSGVSPDLNKRKNNPRNYHPKPRRSEPIVELDDDFEADFQDFKDWSDDEGEIDVKKPFTFSASKNSSGLKESWAIFEVVTTNQIGRGCGGFLNLSTTETDILQNDIPPMANN